MTNLVSCYFCGKAVDASVKRYPLTPPRIDVDTGRTVTLCSGCRQKLGTVFEIVADELDDTTTDTDTTDSEPATTETEDTSQNDGAGAGQDNADESIKLNDASGANAADVADSVDDSGENDIENQTEASKTETETNQTTTASEPESDQNADTAGEKADESAGGEADEKAESGTESASTSTSEAGNNGASAGTVDTAADPESLLSTPPAKKIIRLLQNREFPVDREEFVTVASNAYDIPRHDCEDVIDALASEGYVAKDGSKLIRPDE